jgi:hypothetical protein
VSLEVTRDVWEWSQARGSARLVLLAIADRADAKRRCAWPSVRNLAGMTRLSETAVHRALRELVVLGEVVRMTRFGHSNEYVVATFDPPQLSLPGVPPAAPLPLAAPLPFAAPRGCRQRHPEPSVNRQKDLSLLSEKRDTRAGADARLTPETLVALWNEAAVVFGLPGVSVLTEDRRRQARRRLQEYPARATWEEACRRLGASPFCRGENDTGWRAGLDFLLRPGRVARVLDGMYDDARAARSAALIAEMRAHQEARGR